MADEQTLKPCPFCGSETAPTIIQIGSALHVLQKEWIDGVVCYRKTALLTGADQ